MTNMKRATDAVSLKCRTCEHVETFESREAAQAFLASYEGRHTFTSCEAVSATPSDQKAQGVQ
jgi:hypothetical protein